MLACSWIGIVQTRIIIVGAIILMRHYQVMPEKSRAYIVTKNTWPRLKSEEGKLSMYIYDTQGHDKPK